MRGLSSSSAAQCKAGAAHQATLSMSPPSAPVKKNIGAEPLVADWLARKPFSFITMYRCANFPRPVVMKLKWSRS